MSRHCFDNLRSGDTIITKSERPNSYVIKNIFRNSCDTISDEDRFEIDIPGGLRTRVTRYWIRTYVKRIRKKS